MKAFFFFLGKILNLAKKVFIVFAVYFIVVTLFFHFINKDKPKTKVDPVQLARKEIYKNINNPQLNKTKEGKQAISIYRAGMCGLIGEGCSNNPSDGDKNFDQSFFGLLTKGIILTYSSPPASGIYWAYSGLQNAGFVPKTYAAQGTGFAAIQPISGIWKIFRDAALILNVLVLIAIGFLIMFRVKVNPQTIITLESSLPRIVLSILLIVFSFAIVGFMIDLMYIISALGILLLNRPDVLNHFINGGSGIIFGEIFANHSVWDLGNAIFSLLPSVLSGLLRSFVISSVLLLLSRFPVAKQLWEFGNGIPFIAGLLSVLIGLIFIKISVPIIGSLAGWILSLVILLTTGLLLFFRIFFMLLMAYIRILLFIIFAPVLLLLNAIPGRNMFATWMKNLVADLMVFPVTAILLVVSSTIVNTTTTNASNPIWQAPFLSSQAQSGALSVLVGMGILFLIPDLVKRLKDAMGIKAGLPMGAGIFFAGAGGAGRGALSTLGQFGSLGYGLGAAMRFFGGKAGRGIGERIQDIGGGGERRPPPGTPAGPPG